MNIKHLAPAGLAVAIAAYVSVPEQSQGYSLIGHNLGLGQRDFRVFNNFTDVQANNNTTPDPEFPGYTGATLAIWKACVEWGSRLHGAGGGDPHQPGGLGSGGANFDPSFQGEATTVGGFDNIHSELQGNGGGVLAFMEGGGGGWRIRYYSNWTWSDGPGNANTDLQGIATHEYGHSLGLGHGVNSATMGAFASGNGYVDRSIASDDINGIRAIYGVAGAGKPIITGVSIGGGGTTTTISGFNFSPTDNEVWFTQKAIGGSGNPIKVTNVTSDGTTINVTIPVGSGKGDVLVRNNGGGHANLSNAYPFDGVGPDPSGPNIASVNPSTIASLQPFNDQFLTLNGTELDIVNSLKVDGSPLGGLVSPYTIVSSNLITVAPPPLNTLGAVEIEVDSALGNDITTVDVIIPPTPVLRLQGGEPSELLFSFTPTEFKIGGDPTKGYLLLGSISNAGSSIPGEIDLGIGNNFTQIVVLGVAVPEAKGWTDFSLNLSGLGGLTLYFQTVEFDPQDITDPYPTSNVSEALFVF